MLRLLLTTILAVVPVSAGSLDRYQWKNRLIVFSLPGGDEEAKSRLKAMMTRHRDGITDRDLLWIDLSPKPTGLPDTHRPRDRKKLREVLGLKPGTPDFLLVGKDGGVKGRQSGDLDLPAWFRLIDSMPMRQREMEDR